MSAAGRELWPRVGTSDFYRDNSPCSSKAGSDDRAESIVDREGGREQQMCKDIVTISLAINTPGSPCPSIMVPSNSGISYRVRERWGADIGSILERI